MANVQKRMQAMTVEFEEMSRIGLFSKDEVRIMIKKTTEFENKIDSYSRSLQNYNDYIDYNLCIYRLIKTKRKRLKVGEKKNTLEQSYLKRIKGLFDTTLQLYPANKEQYLNYYKFCRETHFIHAAAHICENMVKYHNSEDGWLTAARWHLHDSNDFDMALKFLKRGLAIHKESQILYTECVYVEIKKVKNLLSKENNPQPKIVVLNVVLKKYLEKMINFIKDSQHYIDILVWMESYDFTMPTQQEIIKYLIEQHWDNEYVWDLLAHREKRGIHYSGLDEGDSDLKLNSQTQFLFCIERYKNGLERVPQQKKKALWRLYIKCLVDAKHEDYKNSQIEQREILTSAFNKASDDGCLCEEGYISWLDLVNDTQARNILQVATTKCPDSVDLWKLRLRYTIIADCRDDILSTFKKGVEALKEDSCSLWLVVLRYHILNSSENEIEEFYRTAVKQHANISHLLMPRYLERLFLKQGITTCRKTYHSLARVKPYCKNLHITMSQLESSCVIYDIPAWEEVHNLAVEQFAEDIDIWLNFIDFHLYYKKSPINDILLVFQKAKAALPNHLFIVFEDKCTVKFNKIRSIVDNNNKI